MTARPSREPHSDQPSARPSASRRMPSRSGTPDGAGMLLGVPGLLGVLDGSGLANDGDLDLARVGQLVLDLLDDVAGEPGRGQVVDLVRPDEDPDLAAGLDRERLLDAGEA